MKVPLFALLRSREAFMRPDLPVLTVTSDYGVRIRDMDAGGRALSEDLSNYRVVRVGDLVVNRLWARFGAYGVSEHEGIISPAYWVLVPRRDIAEPRFLHSVLRSAPYRSEIARLSKNLPPNGYDLPWSQFRRIMLDLPPTDEQRSIADFLDIETARIDALITKKRRLVDLLEERINSQIRSLVRESPLAGGSKFRTVPIRQVLTKLERWADEGSMITAFRDGEVTTREARGRDGFTNAWTTGARVQRVETGDVVIHGLDGFSGAIGDAQRSGVCSPVNHVCTARRGDGAFYGRMLRLLALNSYLGNFATSTRERAVDFRNWDLFGRIPVPLIPTDQQRAIGEDIRRIRPLRDLIRRSEALTLEHRQALITSAVTSELKIPEVAA